MMRRILPSAKKPEWFARALCRGSNPDYFFPFRGEDAQLQAKEAKAVCARCPVKTDCLEHALKNDEKQGIWGGTSERDRRKIRAQRKLDAEFGAAKAAAKKDQGQQGSGKAQRAS